MSCARSWPTRCRRSLSSAIRERSTATPDSGTLDSNPVGIAEYNDILLRNAFGNYKTLLSQVTHSPAMGVFLSHYRNQKTDWTMVDGVLTPATIQPDENYAREVMQLFSIGLIERELDFSPLLDSEGNTIPTYDQDHSNLRSGPDHPDRTCIDWLESAMHGQRDGRQPQHQSELQLHRHSLQLQ